MRLDTPKVGLGIVTLQQTLAIVAREMLCVIHYILRQLETLESLKINANAFMSGPIFYCDDMHLCQIG